MERQFTVKTINGCNLIEKKCKVFVLGKVSTFFILPNIKGFDGIVGYDFLKEIESKIDTTSGYLYYEGGKEKLNNVKCEQVNSIYLDKDSVPALVKNEFDSMIKKNFKAFAEPNRALPFNTKVKAKIRTTSSEPIYTRSYPYPVSAAGFINKEIEILLKEGIIRKSNSAYNSPVHVVNKKGLDEYGKQKLRMVIDFRKLNEKTIADKYPIPDISTILANLGSSRFFTTLDLKSGFHQIILEEKDREKTAFSINNGKYEFNRLPFGLKNAPSIFQRAIDDVLRDDIGQSCQVYMDDIIIFSRDEKSHIQHVDKVLGKLERAGMRVSAAKTKFFKDEVEFLGFIVSRRGIKTCPNKVKDIIDYRKPETLRALRSFLGLSGYYRRFIRDYASIVKPLTKYLRGENGHVSSHKSKHTKIVLDDEAIQAFKRVKSILASEDVLLFYPDYDKTFELTTDASSSALGAVLSQNGRPITMISRTLSKTEENYATNERELLAIVWALKNLRHYLYGIKDIVIFTDHQPLTFAISNKNPNTKMKRWRAFIEEFSPKFVYKPGRDNVVADALSRQFLNNMSDTDATAHSESSLSNTIKTIQYPVNQFKRQFILTKGDHYHQSTKIIFQKKIRYTINYDTIVNLLHNLKKLVNPSVTNALCCDLPTLSEIQGPLVEAFPGVKFIHTEKFVIDLTNPNDQQEAIATEHARAHRSLSENFKQILSEYYFPDMRKMLRSAVSNCKICLENKYQRKPPNPEIGRTPIPERPGEILHLDILITGKQLFLTAVDRFSKFAIVKPVISRCTIDIKEALLEVLGMFQNTKTIVTDNERAFTSNLIRNMLRDHFSIEQFFVPTLHSESNGQVEKFHSTLLEIARCVKAQQQISEVKDLILLAAYKYNRTIHSVVDSKPIEILQNCPAEKFGEIRDKLIRAQNLVLNRLNEKRITKTYQPGERVFLRRNKRLGSKFEKVFVEKIVERDLGTTVQIEGRKIHKSNLR